MLTEEYFKNRLSDIYDYSLIKYLSGEGYIEYKDNKCEIEWELNVSIEGKTLIILSVPGIMFTDVLQNDNTKIKLEGKTDYKNWSISSKRIHVDNTNHEVENEEKTVLFCSIGKEPIFLEKISDDEFNIDNIKGYITNFEVIKNFETEIKNRIIKFKQNEKRKNLIDLIEKRRIDRAIFSTINIPVLRNESLEDVHNILVNICDLLSLININFNFCNILKYYDESELVKIKIENKISESFHRNVILDNYDIKGGLKYLIENCFEKFIKLNKELNLESFISIFSEMYEGNLIIDNKLAKLIISYEYLLTEFLLYKNEITTAELESNNPPNIQSKIGKLNGQLQFIEDLDGKKFRSEVRNNLFHLGSIPDMSFDEKSLIFDNYFELLIKIILKILGYERKYFSRYQFQKKDVNDFDYLE